MRVLILFFSICISASSLFATPVTNISAFVRDGQVFVTWDNLTTTGVQYVLYRSPTPLVSGQQLSSSQNLGTVRDNSALNQRLTNIFSATTYLKTDSAALPLSATRGLFVATSSAAGQFYYAVTTRMGSVEDTTIVPGSNSLTAPMNEVVVMPRPVWQERRTIGGREFDIYVQFVTRATSAMYPKMTNVGSFPFHFAIVKGGTAAPHPVTFWLHWSGANFLNPNYVRGIGDPNEWIVTIDDWLPNVTIPYSIYYGFHRNYDIFAGGPVPVFSTDTLYNYTAARVEHTIQWCLRNLPLDSTRTYMTGWSMGAIGSIFTSLMIPSKIAAIFIYAPRFNLALPIPTNPGANDLIRVLWGDYFTNLPTNEGFTRNERLDANFLADTLRRASLPVIYTFCGRSDANVGWDEKPIFYQTGENDKHGMLHFWGPETHQGTFLSSPWAPNFPTFASLGRYRTNLSYPAFSNCSINHDPGNGDPANGDILGTINGHLDWNDDIVDTSGRWEATLRVKDLMTTSGALVAPDSATVSVTLRRLQRFSAPPGSTIRWENLKNLVVVQQGTFFYAGGLFTIPNVKVYKASNRLRITTVSTSVAGLAPPTDFRLEQNHPNPFNPSTKIAFSIPVGTGHAPSLLKVYDVLGREVRTLVHDNLRPGSYEVTFDGTGLASGVYFYRLQAGELVQMKKLMLVR